MPSDRDLIKAEGWEIEKRNNKEYCKAFGQEFPITHPVQIYLKLYRDEKHPELKYLFMKKAHDYLWPNTVWHEWTEIRFKEHCNNHCYIGWAGGASTAKSFDAAKIALLFWLANPKKRSVIIASTTLESVTARVWGYLSHLLSTMTVPLLFEYLGGNSPKVLYPKNKEGGNTVRDTIHGIFAVAARQGGDDTAISTWIGRHPLDSIMLVLDEATDLNTAIVKAFPNLDSSEKPFQCIAIGNSCDKGDLHGAICTPKKGWRSVDPMVDTKWETTQKNGICLFFSCYNSPAIHETNPDRKKKLSKFLITAEAVKEKEDKLGKDSDSFWRFVLGFWRTSSSDEVVLTKEFIKEYKCSEKAEWLGINPLRIVAGLDPAFSTGGDSCLLRFAYMGQTVNGDVVLDFRREELMHNIIISATSPRDAALQISDQVLELLMRMSCPMENLCIDATGQGRALGAVLQSEAKSLKSPIKIYSTRGGNTPVNSFDVIVKSYHELWFDFRAFVQEGQIRGMDFVSAQQFSSRKIVMNPKTLKRQIENKADYKKRMGAANPTLAHSPDEADAMALCLQSAIINFGFKPGLKWDIPQVNGFEHHKFIESIKSVRAHEQAYLNGEGKKEMPLLEANFNASIFDQTKFPRSLG